MSAAIVPDDDQTESAVLLALLDVHPAPLTRDEVRARIAHPHGDPRAEHDAVDRALAQAVTHGAALRLTDVFRASRAAVYTAAVIGR